MSITSGKHMICDVKEIQNWTLLNDINRLKQFMDEICDKYNFTVINRAQHEFSPHGFTIVYLLSESHISVHTYPEHRYVAMDLYTCRDYQNNDVYYDIYRHIITTFEAKLETPIIIDRIICIDAPALPNTNGITLL
jgi:S-adenosylmethionine decarboxylase proenzyme